MLKIKEVTHLQHCQLKAGMSMCERWLIIKAIVILFFMRTIKHFHFKIKYPLPAQG